MTGRDIRDVRLRDLVGAEKEQLVAFARGVLAQYGDEADKEKEPKSESKESKKEEAKEEAPAEPADVSTHGGNAGSTFVFNLGASEKWPASKGTSLREKQLAASKKGES